MGPIQVTTLENGMRLLTERVDYVDTVTLGVWLTHGSRDEAPDENGMFHFIEHTLFKGTADLSARRIAEIMDGMGGVLDAYTSKEETCYSVKVPTRHLSRALDIMAEMLCHPIFDREELDRERMVVLEEIKMEEDNPEDLVYERNLQAFWRDHPLGRPILGTRESVSAFRQADVRAFHQRFYRTQAMVVAAAGKVDHQDLIAQLSARFPTSPSDLAPLARKAPKPHAFQIYLPTEHHEQVNFCLSFPGISHRDPDRFAYFLLSTLLGGSMSSRLFQKIREDRGLVYHIGTFLNSTMDGGIFTIYGGCSPEHFPQVMRLSLGEVSTLVRHGPSAEELARAREHYIGSTQMSLEATQARASAMAKAHIYRGEKFDLEAGFAALERVSLGDVQRVAATHLRDDFLGLTAIGRLPGEQPQERWSIADSLEVV